MEQSLSSAQQLRELIGADLARDELTRLARVDSMLRTTAVYDRTSLESANGCALRSRPRSTPTELKLTFGELVLIYKALQAVKTRGALPPQDELLNDTIQLVDQALRRAV